MKTNFLKNITLLFILFFATSVVANGEEQYEVDHISIATLLIYDGNYKKAKDELDLVDKQSKNFDSAKFYTVNGVLDSKTNNIEGSILNYKKAIQATKEKTFKAPKVYTKEKYLFSIGKTEVKKPKAPIFDANKVKKEKLEKLYLYLSQSYYKLKDYKNTALSLELAGQRGKDRAALFSLRAECYYKIKDYHKTIDALNQGSELFKEDSTLLKQKFYYLADLGLYQSAIDNAKQYMEKVGADSAEYLLLAQLLIEASQIDESIKILEIANAKFPKVAKLKMLLGHMYMKKNMSRTTAHMFKLASYNDTKFLGDAVEMHRRNKDYAHAIFLNTQMPNKVQKIKQKIAIYLDRGEFEKIIGLTNALKRYNILEDDNIRYALAYSFYMAKDYTSAEDHLKLISDNELFSKATLIRKNIEKCQKNNMECI